jgi:hypothetical protein
VHVGDEDEEPGKALAALDDAELGGLLDRVDGIAAGLEIGRASCRERVLTSV